jgi:hypothetical protein
MASGDSRQEGAIGNWAGIGRVGLILSNAQYDYRESAS